jgi:hypothetical protein
MLALDPELCLIRVSNATGDVMSFQLSSATRDVQLSYTGWLGVLQLAMEHGWRPAGTVADTEVPELGHDPDLRNGPYHSNDGLLVTDADAEALAAALRRASSRPGADVERISRVLEIADEGGFRIW